MTHRPSQKVSAERRQSNVFNEERSLAMEHIYPMKHKRKNIVYIINNFIFGHGERKGSVVDEESLTKTFTNLSFDVQSFQNKTRADMVNLLENVSRDIHKDTDCFVCVILTHGEEDMVHGTDGPVEVTKLLAPFKGDRCPALAGKPKLFFIQACRGKQFDDGADALSVKNDGPEDDEDEMDVKDETVTFRIPRNADFLVAYASVRGFYAWRNEKDGSWFIQALCKVLEEHGQTLDLMTMLTRVNHTVAFDYSSKGKIKEKKQIPCITSMLTKDVFFRKT
uniref:Caspase-3 n=1 Tax=Haliotis diversicolor TaxID=36095 RepID=A0A3G1VB60_HALDV|nr:caspase-3 [Haliotis diversicolor]